MPVKKLFRRLAYSAYVWLIKLSRKRIKNARLRDIYMKSWL